MRAVGNLKRPFVVVAFAAMVTAAACAGPGSNSSSGESDPEGEIPSASTESLIDPATDEGRLIWYTSNTRPAADAIAEVFESEYPGIEVEVFQAGGSQVIAKVEAESMSGTVKADVVDYSEGAAAEGQAERGLFQRYLPPNVDEISERLVDDEGYWFSPWYLTSTIVYNTDLLREDEVPTSWQDLLEPQWRGKVGMASPDYAGTAVASVAAWQQEFGDEYVQGLGENGLTVFEGFGNVHEAVLSGQTPLGINLSFRSLVAEREGEPMRAITPDEGQLLLSFATAIPEGARHPNAAKLFSNFLLTEQVQTLVAEDIGYFPGMAEIAEKADMPDTAEMKVIAPDLATMADPDYIAEIKRLFDQATS